MNLSGFVWTYFTVDNIKHCRPTLLKPWIAIYVVAGYLMDNNISSQK